MAGFTAINRAPVPERPLLGPQDPRRNTEHLGPSEHAEERLPAVAAHLHRTAATSQKKKKRVSVESQPRHSKRRRSNSTVTATAPVDQAARQKTAYFSNQPVRREQSSTRQSTKSVRKRNKVSSAAAEPADASSRSNQVEVNAVSVYAPTTSMDVLDSTSMRTSLDVVKAGGGRACTLYDTVSSTIVQSAVDFSTPLLPPVSTETTDHFVHEAEGRDVDVPNAFARGESARLLWSKAKVDDETQRNTLFVRGPNGKDASHMRSDTTESFAMPDSMLELAGKGTSTPLPESEKPEMLRTQSIFDAYVPTLADALDEAALADLVVESEDESTQRTLTRPPRSHKQNMRDVDEYEDYGGALLSSAERRFLYQHKPDVSQVRKPIVRRTCPLPILDRSSIAGASKATLLRTCFRLGEALNTGSRAARTNSSVVIELYARVTSSWREQPPGRKQHFVFADIYHDKPPILEGTFELYNQAHLWDLDSQAFLTTSPSGRLCRAIVKMKRHEHEKWKLEVLNIWEATWADVDLAAEICGRSN